MSPVAPPEFDPPGNLLCKSKTSCWSRLWRGRILVTPGGSLVPLVVSLLPLRPPSASVCTVLGCEGLVLSLSTGNSLSVPAARSGISGWSAPAACKTWYTKRKLRLLPARPHPSPMNYQTAHHQLARRFFGGAAATVALDTAEEQVAEQSWLARVAQPESAVVLRPSVRRVALHNCDRKLHPALPEFHTWTHRGL